jgi:hypothetical protein
LGRGSGGITIPQYGFGNLQATDGMTCGVVNAERGGALAVELTPSTFLNHPPFTTSSINQWAAEAKERG